MKIIIAVARKFQDYPLLASSMDRLMAKIKELTILTQDHKFAREWAFERMKPYKVFRDEVKEMLLESDGMVAFQSDEDKDLKRLVKMARKMGLKVKEIK